MLFKQSGKIVHGTISQHIADLIYAVFSTLDQRFCKFDLKGIVKVPEIESDAAFDQFSKIVLVQPKDVCQQFKCYVFIQMLCNILACICYNRF